MLKNYKEYPGLTLRWHPKEDSWQQGKLRETEHLRAQVCQFFTVGQTQNLMWGLSATAYLQRILHPNNNNSQQNAPFLAVSTWVAFKLQKTMWKNQKTNSADLKKIISKQLPIWPQPSKAQNSGEHVSCKLFHRLWKHERVLRATLVP